MRHGDWPRWQAAISALPEYASDFALSADVVCVGDNLFGDCDDAHPGEDVPSGPVSAVTETLELLMPWRKGPFRVGGIHIDSEWRSDLKWARLAPHLPELTGKRVLDVGGGNGYFGFRLLAGGADAVIGIDPTLRFLAQYELLHRLARKTRQWILPLRLEEVSPPAWGFDLVLSMGVLYHQRDPEAHLRDLCAQARPGAEVVVETLILPPAAVPTHGPLLRPTGRYARMRNVWALPSLEILLNWITAAGLTHARCVDVCPTLPAEQRTTRWMQGPSLRDFLDPTDAGLTEEGLPAPTRAIIVARCPGDAAGSRVPADVGEPGGP